MINSIDYITTYHYCTNGYIENDKYHFYVKDYQGNNRVVFDQDGTIEQLNHYYPYGGLFSEGTANTNQPYKFGGKELDRMNGLDLYDFGARMLDSAAPTFMTMDRYAEKYPNISPYSYCGGNPIANIDVNGDSIAVLNYGTGKDQHLAILIQNKEGKWAYYSVNGDDYNVSGKHSGGREFDDIGENTFDSPQQFLDSYYNQDGDSKDSSINSYGFSEAFIIPTTKEQDTKIRNNFIQGSKNKYDIISNNCATNVLNSISGNGVNLPKATNTFNIAPSPFSYSVPQGSIPSIAFKMIMNNNPKGKYIHKRK